MSNTQNAYDFDTSDVFLYILAFIIPPVPVFIRYGFFSNQFLLNVLLTLLFGLPGTIHSVYLVYRSSNYYINNHQPLDYERIVETEPTSSANPNSYSDEPENKPSSSTGPILPSYEESTQGAFQNPTDNKVQR